MSGAHGMRLWLPKKRWEQMTSENPALTSMVYTADQSKHFECVEIVALPTTDTPAPEPRSAALPSEVDALRQQVAMLRDIRQQDVEVINGLIADKQRLQAELDAEHAKTQPPQSLVVGWQPIDSAPRDRTKILAIEDFPHVWDDDDGSEKSRPGDCEVVFWSERAHGWIGFGLVLESFDPTHWMPLPSSPNITASEVEG